jgi:hypothetical protein
LTWIDFERCAVAGELIYSIEGDSTPNSQQDEEVRTATLAYALKKLGSPKAAAEFMRCLNKICKGQTATPYYSRRIAGFVCDEWTEWLSDPEADGATVEDLNDALRHVEALD